MQDVFDMPYPLARDRIEHSLRAKMASLQVRPAPAPARVCPSLPAPTAALLRVLTAASPLWRAADACAAAQERMAALASCAAEDEPSERELELDAQLAAARAIIGEQEAIIQAALLPGHSPE